MPPETSLPISDRRASWRLALVLTWLGAIAGFSLALHQFILKYLYDQSSYTRTAGGMVMILLGFAGICVPLMLHRNRRRFLSLPILRQWILALGLPMTYVLILAGCLEASQRSRTILLPRPFTPTAIVHYRAGNTRVEFRGGWRPDIGPAGYNDANILPDGSEEFSSYLYQSFIRDALAGPETVAIVGRARRDRDKIVQIVLDVRAKEAIRLDVENLDEVKIVRDGQPLVASQPQLGIFRVTITGRPKNGTK